MALDLHLAPASPSIRRPRRAIHRAALSLGLALGLGSAGCSALCELEASFCAAPCEATTLPEGWKSEPLGSLVPSDEATVCEASVSEDGSAAKGSFWVATEVHDANMDAVEGAQDDGWSRIGDNWYGTSGDFDTPKWSEFANERGELLRIDVHGVGGGARVDVTYQGFPPLPELEGDVTLFQVGEIMVAMTDGQLVPLWGAPGGGIDATSDGFFYSAKDRTQVMRYGPNAGVHPHPIAIEGSGQLGKHGVGPDGGLWITFDPNDDSKSIQLGHLHAGDWEMVDLPAFDPPLTGHIELAHGTDGTLFLAGGQGVHARTNGTWRSAALPDAVALDGLTTRDDGSAVVLTNKEILSVRIDGEGLDVQRIAKASYPKVVGQGSTIVVRNSRKTMLLEGEGVTSLKPLHDRSTNGDVAVGADGTIAVTIRKPSSIVVRTPDGTVTRYPEEGALPWTVDKRVWVDGTGRVYAATNGPMIVIEDGTMKQMPVPAGLEGPVYSVAFMGQGAEPVGAAAP